MECDGIMDFISNKSLKSMRCCKPSGLHALDDLFEAIPAALKLKRPSRDDGISEYEGLPDDGGASSKKHIPFI